MLCRCPDCLADPISPEQYRKFKADEARLLLAPMLEANGEPEAAQRQRDWALATYPIAGTA